MAYGIVHFFPNGTKAQYEATLAAVHPDRNSLPKGQVYHAAGASEGGWTVIAIHDSKETWETFKNEILMPKLTQGVQGGFQTPPQSQEFEVAFSQTQKSSLSSSSRGQDLPESRI